MTTKFDHPCLELRDIMGMERYLQWYEEKIEPHQLSDTDFRLACKEELKAQDTAAHYIERRNFTLEKIERELDYAEWIEETQSQRQGF